MQNKFYIEYFSPKYLKKSDDLLDIALKKAQKKHHIKHTFTSKDSSSKSTLWNKMKHSLHLE